jgi:hypothetical protein
VADEQHRHAFFRSHLGELEAGRVLIYCDCAVPQQPIKQNLFKIANQEHLLCQKTSCLKDLRE